MTTSSSSPASAVVSTDGAPAPAHTFSQGIRKGGLLQVSGQGPMDPATNRYIGEGDVRAQTRRTLDNVKAILEAGGSGVEDVLMFRVYLTKREDFPAMNEAYGDFIAANVTDLIDRADDPAKTIRVIIMEMEETLVEVRAAAARSIADSKEKQRQVAVIENLQASWTDRAELARIMSTTWATFARTGNPNNDLIPTWPAYDTAERATMIFDVPPRVENDPRREERAVWKGMIAARR